MGRPPLPLQRLSLHSLSRRARDLLSGDIGAPPRPTHRPRPEPVIELEKPTVITPAPGSPYDAAAAAWGRRRRDLDDLAGVIDVLMDVERRADELNRRAAELLEDWL